MITATIQETKVVKGVTTINRSIKLYQSMDKARKELAPIAREMLLCEKQGKKPKTIIDGVSYDTDSERRLLIEIGAYRHEETFDGN